MAGRQIEGSRRQLGREITLNVLYLIITGDCARTNA